MGASYTQVRAYERTTLRERGVIVAGGVSYSGLITRIGGGGVFFESHAPLQKSQSVLVRFKLACFDEPLVVKGEVRHVSSGVDSKQAKGAGIMFVDIDPRKRAQIVEFVAERGNMLCVVSAMLRDGEPDLAQMQKLLEKVDLDSVGSIDELRARVKAGIDGIDRF